MPKYREDARIRSFKELREYIGHDASVNGGCYTCPGMQALIMYRFGVWQRGLQKGLLRSACWGLYILMHIFVRNVYGIEIFSRAQIGRRLKIAHQSGIVLHPKVEMGDDCLIRQGVSIGRASNRGGGIRAQAPKIGNRVDIGAGAVIAGGITIGDDVVIGPNTVVLTNVPDGALVTVTPSRIIGRPPRSNANKTEQSETAETESNETQNLDREGAR